MSKTGQLEFSAVEERLKRFGSLLFDIEDFSCWEKIIFLATIHIFVVALIICR
jgi:hypothetical protein